MNIESEEGRGTNMATRTVYIVDDNREFRESTQFWLSSVGFNVHAWGNPREAIDALAHRDPRECACLMLDVRMPELSGLDVHDRLIACGAQLPVIYMSGHADVPIAVQAMQKGAVTLLEKPFDDEALETALESAFAARAPPRPPTRRRADPARAPTNRAPGSRPRVPLAACVCASGLAHRRHATRPTRRSCCVVSNRCSQRSTTGPAPTSLGDGSRHRRRACQARARARAGAAIRRRLIASCSGP